MISESLARRYSVALFNLARDRNELEMVYDGFKLFTGLLGSQDKFRYFLFSPKVETDDKKKILRSIFGGELSRTILHFVFLLLDKKRQTLLFRMYGHFTTLYNNYHKKATVTVRPAAVLSRRMHDEIKRVFEKALNKTVTIREEVDLSIIGGLQIRVNNTVYDTSIAFRLQSMKRLLSA